MQLDGAVALLTGASGGIGRALAHALEDAGVGLILLGRNESRLRATSEPLAQATVRACCIGDLTDEETRRRAVELARQHSARLLINLSGVNELALFEEQKPESVEHIINTNLLAPMLLTQAVLPVLKGATSAQIVNVGSVFGVIGYPGYATYAASKFGMRGFSEALQRELADTNVRVLHVAPRAASTAMNKGGPSALNEALGNQEDPPQLVAQKIVDAMRRDGARTVIGWPERFFAPLNQLFPKIVDRALLAKLSTVKRFAGRVAVEGDNS